MAGFFSYPWFINVGRPQDPEVPLLPDELNMQSAGLAKFPTGSAAVQDLDLSVSAYTLED